MTAPKTTRILIRTTEAQKNAFRALADINNLSLSAWIIRELAQSVLAAGVVTKNARRK